MTKLLELASDSIATATREFPAHALFAGAETAMLVVAQATGRVAEANPAAGALLGLPTGGLLGSDWLAAFAPEGARRLFDACRHLWLAAAPVQVTVEAGSSGRVLFADVAPFRVGREAYLLVRLAEPGAQAGAVSATSASDVLERLDRMAMAFVVTDATLRIEYANRAFAELVHAGSREELQGRSLAQWLALTLADLLRLRDQMAVREAASLLVTTLHASHGAGHAVEVTAIAVANEPAPSWGFTLRVLEPARAPRRLG